MMTKDRRLVAGNGKSVSVYEVLRHFEPLMLNIYITMVNILLMVLYLIMN